MVNKVVYNWFISLVLNSNVEMSEKGRSMGREKDNRCRKK